MNENVKENVGEKMRENIGEEMVENLLGVLEIRSDDRR